MEILFVISYFFPAWAYGGPGKLVRELARTLSHRGFRLAIYSTDAFDLKRRRKEIDNKLLKKEKYKIYFFRTINNRFSYYSKFFLSPGLVLTAAAEIGKFDLVHLHEFFTGNVAIITFLAVLFKIPYIISAHGTLDSYRIKHRNFGKKIFMIFFGKRIIKNSAGFVAATVEETEEYKLLGVPAAKIHHIPNGIDLKEFDNMPGKNIFKKKHNISAGEKVLLYLGRIHKLKGLRHLVEAMPLISSQIDCRLVVAGSDDGYQEELIKLVKKNKISNVVFPGLIQGKEKLQLYRDSDVFVYPSLSEGFSLAVLEAAAAGLPLVITYGCKFPQVAEYNAGYIVSAKAESLASAVIKILKDEKKRKSMGRSAGKMIKNDYSITVMAKRLAGLYKNIS